MHINHKSIKTVQDILQLVTHEFQRVFKDRCFPQHRDQILSILSEGFRIHFKVHVYTLMCMHHYHIVDNFYDTIFSWFTLAKNIIFIVDFLDMVSTV